MEVLYFGMILISILRTIFHLEQLQIKNGISIQDGLIYKNVTQKHINLT